MSAFKKTCIVHVATLAGSLLSLGGCEQEDEGELTPSGAEAPCAEADCAPGADQRPHTQRISLAEQPKVDVLFVMDNSGSMCEEQHNLGQSMRRLAEGMVARGVDLRVATTTTDMRTAGHSGRFQSTPTPAEAAINCAQADGTPFTPSTADCPADLPAIIEAGPETDIDVLARQMRCQTTVGTQGDGFEMGLEAMRLALSCDGPNRELFGDCCVEQGGAWAYDPLCEAAGADAPRFLRPDATQMVVFVSDENDCSDPAANPSASRLAICKHGAADADDDGIPDGYADATLCVGGDAAACLQQECGELDPETCAEERCAVSRAINSSCEWQRDLLTPVSEYRDFLMGLKGNPGGQILVAAIVGERMFTEAGAEVTFNPPEIPTESACDPDHEDFGDMSMEECCPGGQCEGRIQPSCESANGVAFSGYRYLELAESFGAGGVGCPADGSGDCVSICRDDFAQPLEALQDRTAARQAIFCLEAAPACLKVGDDGAQVPCETEEERANPALYPVEVSVDCEGEQATCDEEVARGEAWTLNLDEPACPGGASVRLMGADAPSADYRVRYPTAE